MGFAVKELPVLPPVHVYVLAPETNSTAVCEGQIETSLTDNVGLLTNLIEMVLEVVQFIASQLVSV
jgi:hypothetical protein